MPKILLVEDNEINRDMLSRRLARKGYEVTVAVDGAEAIAQARSARPDLVLMDLHLPVLDGWEATRQLKRDAQTQSIPVIALTANALTGDREKALAAGCDEYETKPVNLPQLLEKITLLLPAIVESTTEPPSDSLPTTAGLPAASTLRLELLTPLSTIIGYCEILLEEAPESLGADLKKIYASAQAILGKVNSLDSWGQQQLKAAQQEADQIKAQATEVSLEQLPIGVYRATAAGHFSYTNPSWIKLIGYPDAEKLAEAITDIKTQVYVDSGRYAEFKYLLESHDQVIGFEYQAYCQDGSIVWLSEHARAIRDDSDELVGYEAVAEEITQRKMAETALNQELMAMRSELAQVKQAQQATEIIQTDYFQQLHSGDEAPQQEQVALSPPAAVKILLVEDNELNCDMLSRRLKRADYVVVTASDGADGVLKALAEQPNIILMDISLPVIDGWEATQKLKADMQTCQIPVIALTAHAMAGDREKALAAGCDDYDTKPIDLPRLLGKIEACLARTTVK